MAKILGYFFIFGEIPESEGIVGRYHPRQKYRKARFLRKAQRMQKYIKITPWTTVVYIGMR